MISVLLINKKGFSTGMNFMIHKINGISITELPATSSEIKNAEDILDLMADSRYNDAQSIIIHKDTLSASFFDLKTGIAGEILQKFSNYRMRLAIVGDFSQFRRKSLKDFILESNRTGRILFVPSVEEALQKLSGNINNKHI